MVIVDMSGENNWMKMIVGRNIPKTISKILKKEWIFWTEDKFTEGIMRSKKRALYVEDETHWVPSNTGHIPVPLI